MTQNTDGGSCRLNFLSEDNLENRERKSSIANVGQVRSMTASLHSASSSISLYSQYIKGSSANINAASSMYSKTSYQTLDYQESSNLEQFVTRFLLKETVNQLQSLQNSLECAMETTEEQTRHERQSPAKPEVLSIQWSGKRSNRRFQRNNSLSPSNPHFNIVTSGLHEEDNQWMTQINRLQKLIDRLEKKDLKLEPLEEEVLDGSTKSHILIVQRQMSVLEEELEEFRLALKQYVESTTSQTGSLHIAIQKLSDESRFIVYEFWENSNVWKNHLQTNYNKTFQRSNVDFLETPELMTTMLVPASWWVINNN
nr:PREDICTED: N-terminal EF-hand calcium-binding protein 1-like [Latimeria chalumnae]|eukprot:XP_006012678.2 PREDICTED: N-terminal EF-hand calcium-binding protein 1-like [Latimeria chalumnae]